MRAVGHQRGAIPREVVEVPLTPLREVWEEYLAKESNAPTHAQAVELASRLLEPYKPSLLDLHRHVLNTPHENFDLSYVLGHFVSGGYKLSEQDVILYDLDTPNLHELGACLEKKVLITSGSLGESCAYSMSGVLVNLGTAGDWCAEGMSGVLVNLGTARDWCGDSMSGVLVNLGTAGDRCGEWMSGELLNLGTAGGWCGDWMSGSKRSLSEVDAQRVKEYVETLASRARDPTLIMQHYGPKPYERIREDLAILLNPGVHL